MAAQKAPAVKISLITRDRVISAAGILRKIVHYMLYSLV
jgi:hypothetical protein